MGQQIGNVGVLNLTKATEESIEGIESIGNVGLLLYQREKAAFISKLNIGNIGQSVEIPEGYSFLNGKLFIDADYLNNLSKSQKIFVNGMVIIDNNVQPEQLATEDLKIMLNGNVYAPKRLASAVGNIIADKDTGMKLTTYQGQPPRFYNGEISLSNAFLMSLEEGEFLIINGILRLATDLDQKLFDEKISTLQINGLVSLYENQETIFYKKASSVNSRLVEVIPEGYEVLSKSFRLNTRSIRRFQNKKLYTKKPIVLEMDITNEVLMKAITDIQSTSIVVCHQSIEDVVFEITSNMDTEVISYEHGFIMIEGEETWSNDQFLALENPTNFIVRGQLTLDEDVAVDVLMKKVASIDIIGEVLVPEKKLRGSLQNIVRVNTGRMIDSGSKNQGDQTSPVLKNVGELSL